MASNYLISKPIAAEPKTIYFIKTAMGFGSASMDNLERAKNYVRAKKEQGVNVHLVEQTITEKEIIVD